MFPQRNHTSFNTLRDPPSSGIMGGRRKKWVAYRRWVARLWKVGMWKTFDNVTYDQHSTIPLDSALETDYLRDTLTVLRERMGDGFDRFSFTVFNNNQLDVRPASHQDSNTNKVLLYTADEKGAAQLDFAGEYVAVFKGYLPGDNHPQNVHPLPLGCVNGVPNGTVPPIQEREIDVFFSGHLNRNRIGLYRELSLLRSVPAWLIETAVAQPRLRNGLRMIFGSDFSNAFNRGYICFTHAFAAGLTREAFAKRLQNARIALCPAGFHSAETFRHYEAARAGCVIISDPLPDNGLYRDAPIQQVQSWREGIALARELLRDEKRLTELSDQTRAWWNEHWSPDALAKEMQAKLAEKVHSGVETSRV